MLSGSFRIGIVYSEELIGRKTAAQRWGSWQSKKALAIRYLGSSLRSNPSSTRSVCGLKIWVKDVNSGSRSLSGRASRSSAALNTQEVSVLMFVGQSLS